MKRINYLFALALPALMAACTQEELVTSDAGNNGLKLVENPIENFSLKVNIGDAPETRVTDDGYFQVGDEMGLVWFNPFYNQGMAQLKGKEFYANNRLTIGLEDGSGLWTSDAVIMEGTHFAYLPFQTKWGNQDEYPLQVKGGQEALKVYNETTQMGNASDRQDWMVNHQVYLSPAYEFTADNGGAGINEERSVSLYLFSNRLNIQPSFVNGPADWTVYSYELKVAQKQYHEIAPFVTHAEILANNLPQASEFGGQCNWSSISNDKGLATFYSPVKSAESLTMQYAEGYEAKASDNLKFTFLLLPITKEYITSANISKPYAGEIVLVAHTNYGDVTISRVKGKFDANVPTESEKTLEELYYNGTNDNAQDATTMVGFVGNAGVTRGNGTGKNGNLTATFDFKNIKTVLPEVCSNATLSRALQMIKNYKKALGDTYTEQEIVLCKQPTFSNLAFTEKIEATEEATGVEITVTGQKWTDEEGKERMSEITWKGNSSIAQRIPLTVNIVAEGATLTAEVVGGKGLTETTVYGTLENNGAAQKVTVEESGLLNNNDAVTELRNYGNVYNNPAETSAPEDQAKISELYNYGTVYNYGRIVTVQANNNADADNENTAKIVLMNNENTEDGEAIGAIFNIKDIASGVMDVENNIEYTVEKSDAVKAGAQFAVALNNKATNIFVADGADISATASQQTLNGKRFAARITFKGTSTYTFASAAQFENALKVAEVVLAEGAKVAFENQLANSGVLSDIYALATGKFIMNNASELTLDKKVLIAAATLFIEPNSTVTINTHETDSKLYYIYKSQIQSEIKGVNSINEMPEDVKEAFGWE